MTKNNSKYLGYLTPHQVRNRMRGVYKACQYLAIELGDKVVSSRLKRFDAYVRPMKPQEEGLRNACKALDEYADILELEVRETIRDAKKGNVA